MLCPSHLYLFDRVLLIHPPLIEFFLFPSIPLLSLSLPIEFSIFDNFHFFSIQFMVVRLYSMAMTSMTKMVTCTFSISISILSLIGDFPLWFSSLSIIAHLNSIIWYVVRTWIYQLYWLNFRHTHISLVKSSWAFLCQSHKSSFTDSLLSWILIINLIYFLSKMSYTSLLVMKSLSLLINFFSLPRD